MLPENTVAVLDLIRNMIISLMNVPLPWLGFRVGTLFLGLITAVLMFRIIPRIIDTAGSLIDSENSQDGSSGPRTKKSSRTKKSKG